MILKQPAVKIAKNIALMMLAFGIGHASLAYGISDTTRHIYNDSLSMWAITPGKFAQVVPCDSSINNACIIRPHQLLKIIYSHQGSADMRIFDSANNSKLFRYHAYTRQDRVDIENGVSRYSVAPIYTSPVVFSDRGRGDIWIQQWAKDWNSRK